MSDDKKTRHHDLDPLVHNILYGEGTEAPFSSPLNAEKRQGIYRCAGCGQALFYGKHKFESGTGWPSFYRAINGALETKVDYNIGMPRTEYHCRVCQGHQGHVFEDGPLPTGLRYCNNGAALVFEPLPEASQAQTDAPKED